MWHHSAVQTPRKAWADNAKAICVLLVVFNHATGLYVAIEFNTYGHAWQMWNLIALALGPIRVPLFFVISGYFSRNSLSAPWKKVARPRLLKMLYVYTVWSLIFVGLFSTAIIFPLAEPDYSYRGLWRVLLPVNHLWYLYALAVFFTVAKLVRRVPSPIIIAGGALLFTVAEATWQPIPSGLIRYLFFYLVGAFAPSIVDRLTTRMPLAVWGALTVACVAAAVGIQRGGLGHNPFAVLSLSAMAVPAALQAILRLDDINIISRPLSWLGQRTLPVYVMHIPLLAALFAGFDAVLTRRWSSGAASVVLATLPPAVTVAASAAALLIYSLLVRSPGGKWLFDLPGTPHRFVGSSPDGKAGMVVGRLNGRVDENTNRRRAA
jgi:uncharacterized membrane protein YcfT